VTLVTTPRTFRGMVTAPHHLASQAGIDILKDGGTAVEACVAVAAALAVVYPHMTGVGGDGFWLIAEPDGTNRAIDACGGAASRASLSLYEGCSQMPSRGPLAACTVAGTIGGWDLALAGDTGTLPLDRLLRPAIELAEHGVAITAGGADVAASKSAELRVQPGMYADIFEPQGRPLVEGDRLRQPALARTLAALATNGLDSFYRGALAAEIATDLETLGSPVSLTDLAKYRAATCQPLTLDIAGAKLFNLPPPTQGIASLLILGLFDRLEAEVPDSFAHVHGLVEATKQAFLWRDRHCGDPAHMSVEAQALLDDAAVLDAMTAAVDLKCALPWPRPSALGDTTWFAAADSRGQVVSCIQSTYFEFGSGLVLPRSGICWQNRGSSFRLAENGWNAIKPGRKPFHTLNPALARFADGRVMAYGTMGGEGQPQTQAAVFSRYARFGVPLQEAISAPRWLLGRTWGENSTSLKLESRFDPKLIEALMAAGHEVELLPPFSATTGHAGAIVRYPGGLIEGAADPRSDGAVSTW
jgi:gamma-glutamyltranspeptidase